MEDKEAAAGPSAVAEEGEVTYSPPPSPGKYSFLPSEDEVVLGALASIYGNRRSSRPPVVGEKEAISALAAYCQAKDPVLQEKIKLLTENYGAFRRVHGYGNCFYRGFMFSYLEHILETQDRSEVNRITARIEQYKEIWYSFLRSEIVMEDIYLEFFSVLEKVMQGDGKPWRHVEFLEKCQEQSISDGLVQFLRYVTSGEIQRREAHFKLFIDCTNYESVHTFCRSTERMRVECEGVHIAALSDALGVPIRIVNLDRSLANDGSVAVNHHDFIPAADGTTESSCLHCIYTSDPPQGGSDIAAAEPRLNIHIDETSASESCKNAALGVPVSSTLGGAGRDTSTIPSPHETYDASMASTRGPETAGHLDTSNLVVPCIVLLHRPGNYDIIYPK